VANGNKENLNGLTFYDFLFKLNKAIERNKKEMAKNMKKNG